MMNMLVDKADVPQEKMGAAIQNMGCGGSWLTLVQREAAWNGKKKGIMKISVFPLQ